MKHISTPGFTIVELLVVIAIIGVLAAIILPRLQIARDEGIETKVKTELTIVGKRASVEENKSLTYDVVCGSNGFTQAQSIVDQISAIESFTGETVVCNSTTNEYAVSVPLNTLVHWCVDSASVSAERATALGAGEYSCQ